MAKLLSISFWLNATTDEVAKAIAEEDVNAVDGLGTTPLILAIMANARPAEIALLREAGAKVTADKTWTEEYVRARFYNPNVLRAWQEDQEQNTKDKMPTRDYEHYRQILLESGHYRVLERFIPRREYSISPEGSVLRKAVFVDIETTGLDLRRDTIIEFGAVLFTFTSGGQVVRIEDEYCGFEDPGSPIPSRITQLTGITNEMVRGQRLDEARLEKLLGEADLIIAHNAAFDRPFIDRRLGLAARPWACSQREVPWQESGLGSTKLEFLAYRYGFFYDNHRALDDCRMAVHLLAQPLPGTGRTALAALLDSASKPGYRLWATGAPFEAKELLKSRQYRWDAEARCWWKEVGAEEQEAEVAFLQAEVLGGRAPRIETLTARERYRAVE
jgi:DNA polymerase-3 subunit epsilon